MIVETYEIEESQNEAETLAADGAAMELIEKLNLVGQLSLADSKTATRFPYRKMTKQEGQIYGVLCPVKTPLESYSEGPIPVRVLQVAAHASDLGFCKKIEIWHPDNADIKDPVLVGVREVPAKWGGTDTERYILARWGEELEDLSTLLVIATKIVKERVKQKLQSIRREVESDIAAIEADSIPLDASVTYYGIGR